MKVGFIGLGKMGRGMARNLLKSGAELIIFDINPENVKPLVDTGAEAAESVADLARRVDVLFTSLPGPPEVEEVLLGPAGVMANMKPGLVLFELSTSSEALAKKINLAFKERGATMLDAPISGGPAGAASGEMAIWVGGDKATFDKHLDLLKAMANAPRYMGSIGAGTVTKLTHNMIGFIIMQALAEPFSMAVKAGVDPLELWEALRSGAVGRISPFQMLVSQFLPGKYDNVLFTLKLGHKDMSLATEIAKDLNIPMPLASITMNEMTEALARGYGDQDLTSFLQIQLERAGVEIAVEPKRIQAALRAAG